MELELEGVVLDEFELDEELGDELELEGVVLDEFELDEELGDELELFDGV